MMFCGKILQKQSGTNAKTNTLKRYIFVSFFLFRYFCQYHKPYFYMRQILSEFERNNKNIMGTEQMGVQIGAGVISTGEKMLETASVALTTLIEMYVSRSKGALINHLEKGGKICEIQCPREFLEDVLIECSKQNIPVQVFGPDNLSETDSVTLLYRGSNTYKTNESGDLELDENGNTILTGGDFDRLSDLINKVIVRKTEPQKNEYSKMKQEWEGTYITGLTNLPRRQAELYQKEAQRMGIDAVLTFNKNERNYTVSIKTIDMERLHPDISSIGEKWLAHCALLDSHPDVTAYLTEQERTDKAIFRCFKNIKEGKQYNPLTVYCLSNAENEFGCKSNITFSGSSATYTFFKQNEAGELLTAMDQIRFDLNNPEELEHFKDVWSKIGPHIAMPEEKYKKAMKDMSEYIRNPTKEGAFAKIKQSYAVYNNYLETMSDIVPKFEEIDKTKAVEVCKGEYSIQYGVRIPNSDIVVDLMVGGGFDKNSPEYDNKKAAQITENLKRKTEDLGLEVTPSSRFTSSPTHMLKRPDTIEFEQTQLIAAIGYDRNQTFTPGEIFEGERGGNPEDPDFSDLEEGFEAEFDPDID